MRTDEDLIRLLTHVETLLNLETRSDEEKERKLKAIGYMVELFNEQMPKVVSPSKGCGAYRANA